MESKDTMRDPRAPSRKPDGSGAPRVVEVAKPLASEMTRQPSREGAMDLIACQCEHGAHFHDKDEEEETLTPNGNPSHTYGVKYHPSYMRRVKTDYGVFIVCRDCRNDCHRLAKEA